MKSNISFEEINTLCQTLEDSLESLCVSLSLLSHERQKTKHSLLQREKQKADWQTKIDLSKKIGNEELILQAQKKMLDIENQLKQDNLVFIEIEKKYKETKLHIDAINKNKHILLTRLQWIQSLLEKKE